VFYRHLPCTVRYVRARIYIGLALTLERLLFQVFTEGLQRDVVDPAAYILYIGLTVVYK
jgi:hypothetical protein